MNIHKIRCDITGNEFILDIPDNKELEYKIYPADKNRFDYTSINAYKNNDKQELLQIEIDLESTIKTVSKELHKKIKEQIDSSRGNNKSKEALYVPGPIYFLYITDHQPLTIRISFTISYDHNFEYIAYLSPQQAVIINDVLSKFYYDKQT